MFREWRFIPQDELVWPVEQPASNSYSKYVFLIIVYSLQARECMLVVGSTGGVTLARIPLHRCLGRLQWLNADLLDVLVPAIANSEHTYAADYADNCGSNLKGLHVEVDQ
eukprot:6051655-Amphidinium_carterae.1